MIFAGETEVLGEHLTRRHFVHHKSHLPDPGANPGRRGAKPATNRFSYGAASLRFTHPHQNFVYSLTTETVKQMIALRSCPATSFMFLQLLTRCYLNRNCDTSEL
jgi:hypothetical protein